MTYVENSQALLYVIQMLYIMLTFINPPKKYFCHSFTDIVIATILYLVRLFQEMIRSHSYKNFINFQTKMNEQYFFCEKVK